MELFTGDTAPINGLPQLVRKGPTIFLLYPTGRIKKCVETLSKWVNLAVSTPLRVLIAVDSFNEKRELKKLLQPFFDDGSATKDFPIQIYVTNPLRKGVTYPLYCLTTSLRHQHPNPEDLVVVVSDDFLPVKDGWDLQLREQFVGFSGMLVQDDGYQSLKKNEVVTLPLLTYQCLEKLNWILYHPIYHHMFSDIELYDVVKELNLMKDIREEIGPLFRHHHWVNGGRSKDGLDEQLNGGNWRRDELLYQARKSYTAAGKLTTNYKNLVCFSLWGTKEMYHHGAVRNIQQFAKWFPEFRCRFYIEAALPDSISERLLKAAEEAKTTIEIVKVPKDKENSGMFWRFAGADDPTVLTFLSRDTDSRLSKREVAAVREWLASDCSVHIMRDHPYHNVVMLGGMWGCRFKVMHGIMSVAAGYAAQELKGCDQDFLRDHIYPNLSDDCLVHDQITPLGGRPFPLPREGTEYVGDVYDEHDKPHPEFGKLLLERAPPVSSLLPPVSSLLPPVSSLLASRKNVYSQNGEDGILSHLTKLLSGKGALSATERWFVEFGAWDGKKYSNTYNLFETDPLWKGVYIECDKEKYSDLVLTCAQSPLRLFPIQAFVDAKKHRLGKILSLFAKQVPLDFDILSIDIDSDDYHVWEALREYRPKIVVIEINSEHPPGVIKIHDPEKGLTGTETGTSFTPMVELGRKKGYSLLLHTGNLIFLRDDLVPCLQMALPANYNDLYIPHHRYVFT